jgi:tetratricopeptide (TPR) repeat protein
VLDLPVPTMPVATPTLPFPANLHVAVAHVLDLVWPSGAAWAYADAIAHAPREAELHFLRGHALGRARRWSEAARALGAAARLRPSSAEYQGALVVALDRAGRDHELVQALRRLADLRPGEGEIHVLIGSVLRRAGSKAEALRAFRLAVRLAPTPASRRFVLGETLLGTEGWAEALASWNEARQIEGSSGSLRLRRVGRSALNFHPGGHLARVPKPPSALPRRPRLAALTAWWSAAARFLHDPLRRRGPLTPEARVRAIRRAWRRSQPARAVSLVSAREPASVARHAIGKAGAGSRGRLKKGATALALVLAVTSAHAQERSAAAHETAAAREQARLCERKSLEEGLAACKAALALGIGPPRRAAVRELLARHLVALERWGELADHLREDVRLDPMDPAVWQRLGFVLLLAVDATPEALATLEEAVRLAPTDATSRLGLALALQAAGRPGEAKGAFEEALRLDPDVFEERPAARAAFEAAKRDERWP